MIAAKWIASGIASVALATGSQSHAEEGHASSATVVVGLEIVAQQPPEHASKKSTASIGTMLDMAPEIVSDLHLAQARGGESLLISDQTLQSLIGGNSIDGGYQAGDVTISDAALSSFSGFGNIVINTGAQTSLQAAMNIIVNLHEK